MTAKPSSDRELLEAYKNRHLNKGLQELWNKYGRENFELSVIKVLKYDDPNEDHTAELESLREQCLAADPNARRIWIV
ncbi:hypothetical protein [Clostridium aceticum]|uniref:hypothetical protein n=1 Tax=Clostridium aceticum TaxID=84022 RepID=UPI00069D9F09